MSHDSDLSRMLSALMRNSFFHIRIKDEDLGYEPMKPSSRSEAALNQKPRTIPSIPANALLWTNNGRAPLIEFEEKVL